MPAGKIWAEYWIDCAGPCGDHEALAETSINAAMKRARELGYRRVNGRWWCSACQQQHIEAVNGSATDEV